MSHGKLRPVLFCVYVVLKTVASLCFMDIRLTWNSPPPKQMLYLLLKATFLVHHHVEFWCHPFQTHPITFKFKDTVSFLHYSLKDTVLVVQCCSCYVN